MEELEVIKEKEKIIGELYILTTQRINDVYDIFKNFFGEEFVDLQSNVSFKAMNSRISTNTYFSEYYKMLHSDSPVKKLIDDCYGKNIKNLTIDTLDITVLREWIKIIREVESELYVFKNLFVGYYNIDILVYFPKVRITNEFEKYVDINDLFAKVNIDLSGRITGSFKLNRASYTALQFANEYMHSHVGHIPKDDFTVFQTPCTGQGPINHTMGSLVMEYDENIWNLFCLELSKYVTVESISGVPYHRLESLTYDRNSIIDDKFPAISALYDYDFGSNTLFTRDYMSSFIKKLLKSNKLVFNYSNDDFGIGMTFIDFILTISNEFINWFNETAINEIHSLVRPVLNREDLLYEGILNVVTLNNGKFYFQYNNYEDLNAYDYYIGKKVCTFKGKDYCVSISKERFEDNDNTLIILNPKICMWILNALLKVLNYNYGRNSEEGEDASNKNVIFL